MIIHADILDWAKHYEGDPFHAAFMDAPYEMQFMGKGWDNSGIAFRPETWDAIARHLHPGGWIVSFGGSRTWHRMACAMEDSELIIQPTMFLWAYGSGFPKATRLDTQIDRRAGAERAVVGQRKHAPKFDAAAHGYREKDNGYNSRERESFDLTEPATELARDWAGHRYGGQAIKPAVEPIIFAQKPYDGAPAENMTRTGAGALWIDGARVGVPDGDKKSQGGSTSGYERGGYSEGWPTCSDDPKPSGRWPANLVLSHLPGCNRMCAPGCPISALGEQSGESASKVSQRGRINTGQMGGEAEMAPQRGGVSTERGHDDAGTAARYFYNADWQYERLEATDPVGYFAKASKSEREAGLDDMQVRLMRELYDADEGNEEVDDLPVQHRRDAADWGRRIGGSGDVDRRNFAGFDSTEIVMIKLTHNCQTASEGEPWVSADLEVQLQVVMGTSHPRVIGVSETQKQNASAWSMFLFGNETTAPFLTGIKFTTATKISSTTESKTLNWLTRLLTNESTAGANSDQVDGGNHAESAERSSPSLSFTNDEMVSLPGVGNVPSGTLWTISASAKLETNLFPVSTINDGRKTPIDNAYQRGETSRRNVHPCVKPIALNRWLATLLLPPVRYAPRRLLVPFAGVASEYIGAMLAGWEEIIGVELEEQHVRIAEARIAFWQQMKYKLMNPDAPIKVRVSSAPDGQLELF